ncbi:MAG: 6-pyruvoyl-tetrahydropterin synthase-related protein [Chloroflexota bacterium]|nr:6-pyruvoyl-tetrahydropterin synthase-related protein [Chloroflexota bacterium]
MSQPSINLKQISSDWGYMLAFFIPLPGILSSTTSGIIATADGAIHTHRIHAMYLLISAGELYPRWVPYFHLGYGYPVFSFYAPGSYLLGAGLQLFGLDAFAAFNLLAAIAWIVGSVGCYALARRFLPPYSALLASCLWAYAPSRLFEVWDQGSLPQMLAAACIPWLFWGMTKAFSKSTSHLLAVIYVALPFTAIVYFHQPMTFIAALFALLYGIVMILWQLRTGWRSSLRLAARLGAAVMLAGGLSAAFVLPVVSELRYVAGATGTDDTISYLSSQFLLPKDIFMQPGLTDLTDLRREMPSTFGLIPGVLALVGFAALLHRKSSVALLLAGGILIICFMLLEISLPVWERIPYLAQLRFPERFLRVGVVFVALLGAAALLWLPVRWRAIGAAAACASVFLAALPQIVPIQNLLPHTSLSAVDEIEMEMTAYTWGSTSYNEFNPVWGERIPLDPPSEIERYGQHPLQIRVHDFDCPGGELEVMGDRQYYVRTTFGCTLTFRQFYFPGWQVTLDGAVVEAFPEAGAGLLAVGLPAGDHIVEVRYEGTTAQTAGELISLFSLVIMGIALFVSHRRIPQAELVVARSTDESVTRRTSALWVTAITSIAVIVGVWLSPHTLLFRLQSPPDAPAHMQTRVDANFGDVFMLLGYTLYDTSAQPAGSIDIELYWRALRPIDVEYRPIVQIVDQAITTAYAVSQPFSPGGGSTISYPTDRFASELHRLELFAYAPPSHALISVQMVNALTGEALLLPDGRDRLTLDTLIRING